MMLTKEEQRAIVRVINTGIADNEVNWDVIFDWAKGNKFILQLYSRIKNQVNLSDGQVKRIEEYISEIKECLDEKTAEYVRVCNRLNEHGFSYITFKGIALTSCVFDSDCYRRAFNDLDLIARPDACDEMYEFLQGEGYSIWMNRDKYDVELFKKLIHHYPALSKDGEKTYHAVEVHHRITHQYCPYEFDIEAMIERAQNVEIKGVSVPVPSTEDHLILLCYNLYKSEAQAPCYSIKSLYDILAFVEKMNIDWNKVIAYTKDQHLEMPVYYAFYRTAQIFGEALAKAGFVIDTVNSIKPSDFEESKDFIYEFHTLSDKPMGQWQEPYEDRLFWDKDQLYARYYLKFYEYHENINFSNLCEQFGLPFRTIK